MEDVNETNLTAPQRSNSPWLIILIVASIVILISVGYFFFLSKGSSLLHPSQTQETSRPAATAKQEVMTKVKQVTITGTDFAFTPSTLTLNKGDKVEVTFKNNGKFPHNLTITDLNVATKTVQSGQQDTIVFTADAAGTYKFLCTVPGHADKGMVGALIVK